MERSGVMATSTFEKEIYLQEKAADILAEDLENNEIVKDKEAKNCFFYQENIEK